MSNFISVQDVDALVALVSMQGEENIYQAAARTILELRADIKRLRSQLSNERSETENR